MKKEETKRETKKDLKQEEQFRKVITCLYVIIALLVINTVAVIVVNGNSTTKAETEEKTPTEENTEYDVSMFKSINASQFEEAFNSSSIKVIYMGRSTCSYCVKFLPNLQKAQKEYGYKTLYLDITTVSQDDQKKITELDESFFGENYGVTPTVILVKDGKIVDSHIGYSEYSDYTSFLEKNGIKKK